MSTGTVLAIISGGLALGQNLPYVRAMLKGHTKPSRVACGISVVCNLLMVLSLLQSGEAGGIVLPAIFLVSGIGVFAMSIKYGISKITRTDIIAASVAALAVAAWLIFGTNAAVIGTNTAQVTALIATFNKLRSNPGTEDLTAWSMGGVAAFLSLAGILNAGADSFAALAVPVRCVLSCLLILGLALAQRRAQQPATTHVHHLPFHFRLARHHDFAIAA